VTTDRRLAPLGRREGGPPTPLDPWLPPAPLLSLDRVPGAAVDTLADPFPVFHGGRLFVFAEVLGQRAGAPFKSVGVFEIDDRLEEARYLGDALCVADARYSFPCVVRDGSRYLLLPEVFVELRSADARWMPLLQIHETSAEDFPFGWRLLHEQRLPGCGGPSDKVLLREGGQWWLVCSDNAARQLLAYTSADLRRWSPHPGGPLASRDDAACHKEAASPVEHAAGAWRLGGGPLARDGRLVLPLQHKYRSGTYGGAVTLLEVGALTAGRTAVARDPAPILAEDPSRPWMAHGAHHIALARHGGRTVAATDGFDGRHWTSTVIELPEDFALGPWPQEEASAP
jgi:hypothetical protein